jgi:uncharacterized protein (UPF0335 family)
MSRRHQTHNDVGVDPDQIKEYKMRYSRLKAEMDGLRESMADIITEVKSAGFNPKTFKKAIKVEEVGYDSYVADDEELHVYLRAMDIVTERHMEPVY